jgi:predicted DNA-binding WGR domain protein
MEVYFENRVWPHAKFYRLEMDLVLFDVCLKREWGRIGRKKREKVDYFKTWKEADKVYQRLYQKRIRNGYKIVASRRGIIQWELSLFEKVEKAPSKRLNKITIKRKRIDYKIEQYRIFSPPFENLKNYWIFKYRLLFCPF